MITSAQNKIVKEVKKLKNKKGRENADLFIIEGERFVKGIPFDIEILYYIFSEKFSKACDTDIYNRAEIHIVSEDIILKISDTVNPQGVMAICKIKKYNFQDIKIKENMLFLLLDRVMDPGNLGTIIRSADALGVSAIFLSNGCADIYNSKVLRSTMGSLFNLPIFENCNFDDLIYDLKSKNFNIISSNLKGGKSPYNIDFNKNTVIIIGNEANGVLDKYLKVSDEFVKIPMIGAVESINVSIASSILFYECLSQKLKSDF